MEIIRNKHAVSQGILFNYYSSYDSKINQNMAHHKKTFTAMTS